MGYSRAVHYAAAIALVIPAACFAQSSTDCITNGGYTSCQTRPTTTVPAPDINGLLQGGQNASAAFAEGARRQAEMRNARARSQSDAIAQVNHEYNLALEAQHENVRHLIAMGDCDGALKAAAQGAPDLFAQTQKACPTK